MTALRQSEDLPLTARSPGSERRKEHLSRMLRELEVDIRAKLHSLRVTLPEQASPVKDVEEAGVEDFARDMEIALAEIGSWTLRRIHEALRRLDDGTYGICARCSVVISEARLRALPFAALCTACQEEHEREVPPAGRRPHLFDAENAS